MNPEVLDPLSPVATSEVGVRWIIAGHDFIQNLRCGHYELTTDIPPARRVAAAFTELAQAI